MANDSLPERTNSLVAPLLMGFALWGCVVYVNLSFAVTPPADYRWFPPFEPNVDANENRQLGGENYYIARSLVRGQGFADPFAESSGPTAWIPPALPSLQVLRGGQGCAARRRGCLLRGRGGTTRLRLAEGAA